jgi:hypothetical protein
VISSTGTTSDSNSSESNDWSVSGFDCDDSPDTGRDVCYLWTPSVSGSYEIDTCDSGTSFDTIITIWDSDGSSQLVCNDDDGSCSNYRSKIDFNATGGTTYTIVVDGWRDSSNGSFVLSISPPGYECNTDSDCEDGLWCNGLETCESGSCVTTGPRCQDTGDRIYCDESVNQCQVCMQDSHCDDNNPCTSDVCSNVSGNTWCSNIADVTGSCDDGLYCNGTDTCSQGVCQHSGDPCAATIETCNEATNACDSGGDGGGCTGVSVCDLDFCNELCPCLEGQGDCDSDSECEAGLVCGMDLGVAYGCDLDEGFSDICVPPEISGGGCMGDVLCGDNFCHIDCRCLNGQGDCDSDAECAPGLVCGTDNGASYDCGTGSTADFCIPGGGDWCGDGTCNGTETVNNCPIDCL